MANPAAGFKLGDYEPPAHAITRSGTNSLPATRNTREVEGAAIATTATAVAKAEIKKRKASEAADGPPPKTTKRAVKSSAISKVKVPVSSAQLSARCSNRIKAKAARDAATSASASEDPATIAVTSSAPENAALGETIGNEMDVSDSESVFTEVDSIEMNDYEEAYNEMLGLTGQSGHNNASPMILAATLSEQQASGSLITPITHDSSPPENVSRQTIHSVVPVMTFANLHNDELSNAEEEEDLEGQLSDTDEYKPNLIVTLKIRASALKTSRTPRNSQTPASKTPQISNPRKPARTKSGLPTPPAEQEEVEKVAIDLEAQIDPEQLRLSQKLTYRAPLAFKPSPQGQPEVWADSRQALCETVPYFKMPQSGCHQNDGHVYAFLYDGASRCREYMSPDLIIGGAGGGMEADSTGQLVQKKNHTMDESQVKAVLNDIEHKNPLVVIVGNKSGGAICRMPYRYNVLGWFKPVAVWAEKTMGKRNKTWTTIKYRFERLDQSKQAWSAPNDASVTSEERLSDEERRSIAPLAKQTCPRCSASHPMVYLVGWMCLSPECDLFWKLPNGKEAPYDNLHYNPAFLLARTEWAFEAEPFSVKPPVLSVGSTVGDNLTQINTRGMCCPNCGRCNSRRLFKGWKCENKACAFENFPRHIPVQIPLLHQPWESTGDGPSLTRNKHNRSQGVQMSVDFRHGFKVYRYTFPGVNGALVHLVANTTINKLPGGADEMFHAMQREDLHLERRRFGAEKMSGGKAEAKSLVTSAEIFPAGASHAANAESSADMITSAEAAPTAEPGEAAQQNPLAPESSQEHDRANAPAGLEELQPLERKQLSVAGSVAGMQQTQKDEKPEAKKQQEAEDGDLMTAFSMNYGMPYKFVANGASLPFQGSPWPVRAARADLNWASQSFLDPGGHQDLNEELIFAYMEGQKLEYHDDGEEGLGPRIATLSLGGKAKMHLRMKTKHYVGCSKTGVFVKERPVPGSIQSTVNGEALSSHQMYERRLAAWEELQQLLQLTDKKAYNKRAKEIPLELGLYEKCKKKADDLVTVTLNHGDIVLMEGYEIQQYFEHKVVPEQCLRFALTCRTIMPDHLKPEERPPYGEEHDEAGMSSLRKMANAGGEQGLGLKEN